MGCLATPTPKYSVIPSSSIACIVTDPHPNGSKVDQITMALLIISTGQLTINLVKCTILTGSARKYSSDNTILFGNNCRYICYLQPDFALLLICVSVQRSKSYYLIRIA